MENVFLCPYCQQSLETTPDMAGESVNCPKCGRLVSVPAPVVPPVILDAVVQQPVIAKTSGMAIASMVVAIIGIFGGWMCCGVVLPVIAIILGHVSFSKIEKNQDVLTGKGFAIAGFTIGYVGLIFGTIASLMFGSLSAIMTVVLETIGETPF